MVNHLTVFIDYSLKGATPNEFYWSQLRRLDDSLEEDFDVNDHPQFAGIRNIQELRSYYMKDDPDFGDCIQLSIERGINHQGDNAYINSENSLKWDTFLAKANQVLSAERKIQLSDTDNPIQWTKQYGPKPYFQRYNKRGATIVIKSDGLHKECRACSTRQIDGLLDFLKTLKVSFIILIVLLDSLLTKFCNRCGTAV